MSRGRKGKILFIGPRFENGGKYKPKENPRPSRPPKKQKPIPICGSNPREHQNPKQVQRKQMLARTGQARRIIEKGVRPHELRDDGVIDSVTLNERQSKWLDNRSYLLTTFLRLQNRQELDRRKAVAREKGNLRQARILENGYEYYSLTQVLVTYGKDCHICGFGIDLKASRRVGIGDWPLGLHIDHLIAVANGGPDTLANVRPSHAICNLKKGAS